MSTSPTNLKQILQHKQKHVSRILGALKHPLHNDKQLKLVSYYSFLRDRSTRAKPTLNRLQNMLLL